MGRHCTSKVLSRLTNGGTLFSNRESQSIDKRTTTRHHGHHHQHAECPTQSPQETVVSQQDNTQHHIPNELKQPHIYIQANISSYM